MTTLKATLHDDLTTAIKARDQLRSATLRLTLSAIGYEETAGDSARELSDDEVLKIITREVKKRRDAAEAFEKAGRAESAERERAEAEVLTGYLPAQLSDDELRALVTEAVTETGASGMAGMGTVMKAVQPKIAGRAEGSRVAAEVKRQLSAG
ncbi:GatB/YqeY domain-containing protein [Amycolatopsis sp. NPDC059090]|uniref:GatB/YqeY domain-containing protein n=1 Tax=unclassified Amycolatopsis TaxID=2618356 RepID=UPI00366FAB89